MKNILDTHDEHRFLTWFKPWAQRTGINPNPDDPRIKYDYRAAWMDRASPEWDENEKKYVWPEKYQMDQPVKYELRLTIGGVKLERVETEQETEDAEDGIRAA